MAFVGDCGWEEEGESCSCPPLAILTEGQVTVLRRLVAVSPSSRGDEPGRRIARSSLLLTGVDVGGSVVGPVRSVLPVSALRSAAGGTGRRGELAILCDPPPRSSSPSGDGGGGTSRIAAACLLLLVLRHVS